MVTSQDKFKADLTICDALKTAAKLLGEAGIENSYSEAVILLCAALGRSKEFVYTHPQNILVGDIVQKFQGYVESRIARKPASYIICSKEFLGLEFYVNESVLIPRPETEILVEYLIKIINDRYKYGKDCKKKVRILDIGTGSGCIGISIACNIRYAQVWCVDISNEALMTARFNAQKHGVESRVEFIQSDIFSNIHDMVFDIIVSNPPYISTEDIRKLDPDVRDYEPLNALDGGEDGLFYYRSIISDAHRFLTSQGVLAFEVGIGQACVVSEILRDNSYSVQIVKDLSGIDRVVAGILCK